MLEQRNRKVREIGMTGTRGAFMSGGPKKKDLEKFKEYREGTTNLDLVFGKKKLRQSSQVLY